MTSKTSVYLVGTATSALMLASILAPVAFTVTPRTADAQTVIVGKYKLPSVIMDHSVLENIGNTSDLNQLQKKVLFSSGILPSDHQARPEEEIIRLEGQPSNKIKLPTAKKRHRPQGEKRGLKASKPSKNIPLHSGFKSNPTGQTSKVRPKPQRKIRKTDVVANKPGQPKKPIKAMKTYLSPRQQFHIGFAAGSAILGEKEGATIDTIASSFKQRNSLRIQLLAYADDVAGTLSQTRRLSLSRALAVRSHLINQGIRSNRIDVRALGNKYKDGTPDRVDVIITR